MIQNDPNIQLLKLKRLFGLPTGQIYHRPLRDSHGTVVLSCVNSVKSQKSISALNSRWAPVSKLRRRVLSEDNTIGELLMASVHEQIAYHQVSYYHLTRVKPQMRLKLSLSLKHSKTTLLISRYPTCNSHEVYTWATWSCSLQWKWWESWHQRGALTCRPTLGLGTTRMSQRKFLIKTFTSLFIRKFIRSLLQNIGLLDSFNAI